MQRGRQRREREMIRHFYVYVYVCMYGVYIDMQPHLHLWDTEAANAFI
jgi:hypothetical protein